MDTDQMTTTMTRGSLLDSGRVRIVPDSVGARPSDVGVCGAKSYGAGRTSLGPNVTLASIWGDAPMFWQRKVTPVCQMTAKEHNAELKRQAARMKAHDDPNARYRGNEQLCFLQVETLPPGVSTWPVEPTAPVSV